MADQILSYIWINKDNRDDGERQLIPDLYVDNAFRIARSNPDVDFIVWVESDSTKYDAAYAQRPCNLRFRNLHEIEPYRDDPLFRKTERLSKDQSSPIWQKVDYARVVVMDFLIRTTEADRIFYSDFDVALPSLRSPEVARPLERYGAIFAKSNRNDRNQAFYLENQFMGISRAQADFITGELLPATRTAIVEKGENGWPSLCACARKRFSKMDQGLNNISIRTYEIVGGNSFPVGSPSFPNSSSWDMIGSGPYPMKPIKFDYLSLPSIKLQTR